jgi:hypothetical protein
MEIQFSWLFGFGGMVKPIISINVIPGKRRIRIPPDKLVAILTDFARLPPELDIAHRNKWRPLYPLLRQASLRFVSRFHFIPL